MSGKVGKEKPSLKSYVKQYWSCASDVLSNPEHLNVTCWLIILLEAALNVFIVHNVRYTEIDWRAYMQEVEGFLNGTLDYKLLKGDTGPLVYPAGFVYIYSLFYFLTSRGQNIILAQYLFILLYLSQLYFCFKIYSKTKKLPPYAIIITTFTSYRIHSIYVLRLFNDPIAVLLFYISLNQFLSRRWIVGSVLFSLAVSVKMNILLYAPCLLIAYLTNLTLAWTVVNLLVCASIQLILGAPFLYANWWSYIKGSFDIGRVFEHKWTVNYRFLSRELFECRSFHVALFILHISLLLVFLPNIKKYLSCYAKLDSVAQDLQLRRNNKPKKNRKAEKETTLRDEQLSIDFEKNAQLMVLPFLITNFIGVVCARSLHYQFYSWYFHSLLYLGYCTSYRKPLVFLLLAVIELCWNTYPSSNLSSATLHVCHVILLYGVYNYMKK